MANDSVVRLDQVLESPAFDRSAFKDSQRAEQFLSAMGQHLAKVLDTANGRFSLILYKEREVGVAVSSEMAQELYREKLRNGLLKQLGTRPESIDEIRRRLEEL